MWADAEGREAACVSGVVHRAFPQTPQAAEYLAALAAAEVAQPGHEVMCDCLGVVHQFGQRSATKQLSAKLRYSGVVRLARGEAGWAQVSAMTKVPAHVDLGESLSADQRRKAKGNAAADEAAKAAAARQPRAARREQGEWDNDWNDAVVTAKLIASVAKLWPAARAWWKATHREKRRVGVQSRAEESRTRRDDATPSRKLGIAHLGACPRPEQMPFLQGPGEPPWCSGGE